MLRRFKLEGKSAKISVKRRAKIQKRLSIKHKRSSRALGERESVHLKEDKNCEHIGGKFIEVSGTSKLSTGHAGRRSSDEQAQVVPLGIPERRVRRMSSQSTSAVWT